MPRIPYRFEYSFLFHLTRAIIFPDAISIIYPSTFHLYTRSSPWCPLPRKLFMHPKIALELKKNERSKNYEVLRALQIPSALMLLK